MSTVLVSGSGRAAVLTETLSFDFLSLQSMYFRKWTVHPRVHQKGAVLRWFSVAFRWKSSGKDESHIAARTNPCPRPPPSSSKNHLLPPSSPTHRPLHSPNIASVLTLPHSLTFPKCTGNGGCSHCDLHCPTPKSSHLGCR